MNGARDRISPQYNGKRFASHRKPKHHKTHKNDLFFSFSTKKGSNSSRPASTSTYDIKSDSPSRKRRRVSSRQSPTSSWEHRQSPRSSQNHGHSHTSPLLRRRIRDLQSSQRSWEQVSEIIN